MIRNLKQCVLPLVMVVFFSCQQSGTSTTPIDEQVTELDNFLTRLNENQQFNGGVLVARGDEVLISKTYGYADLERGELLDPGTIFQTASVSKTFTAAAIYQLIEKGEVSLDDPLTKYLPNLPYPTIKIRHLMGHTSGLYPYDPLFQQNWDHSEIAENDDIVEMYEEHKPESFYESGTEFGYSNVAYVFLAEIVERVSGQSFREYLKENIFDELEMMNTRIHTLLDDSISNFAHEHVLDPLTKEYRNPLNVGYHSYVYYLNGKIGDDKVSSTLEDMLIWSKAVFKENFLGDENTGIAFTLSNGHIPTEKRHSKFDYGLGFQLDSTKYGKMIYHNGGEPGLKVRWHYYQDIDLMIILYANAYVNYTRDIKNGIISILNSDEYTYPKRSIADEVAKVEKVELDEMVKVVESLKGDTVNYYLNESEIENIAGVYWSQERYDEGMELLHLNYKYFPNSVGAVYTLGEGYMETDRMEQAIPYFKEAKALMLRRPKEKQNPRFIEAMDRFIAGE